MSWHQGQRWICTPVQFATQYALSAIFRILNHLAQCCLRVQHRNHFTVANVSTFFQWNMRWTRNSFNKIPGSEHLFDLKRKKWKISSYITLLWHWFIIQILFCLNMYYHLLKFWPTTSLHTPIISIIHK